METVNKNQTEVKSPISPSQEELKNMEKTALSYYQALHNNSFFKQVSFKKTVKISNEYNWKSQSEEDKYQQIKRVAFDVKACLTIKTLEEYLKAVKQLSATLRKIVFKKEMSYNGNIDFFVRETKPYLVLNVSVYFSLEEENQLVILQHAICKTILKTSSAYHQEAYDSVSTSFSCGK